MTSEPGPEGREEHLGVLRKRVRRAAKRGDKAEFERLSEEYAAAKAAHVLASHVEAKEQVRARRAQERAEVAQERPERWRLPAGFGTSPLAAQRAREGRAEVPVVPVGRPALAPWRRGSLMAEVVWRPPS